MSITREEVQIVPAGTWTLDPVHSSIGFEIAYMGGTFRGHFNDVDARLADGRLEGSARVASIQVKDENLEAHLQSPDFFDAERHPELRFESSDIERVADEVIVRGEIAIKGVTQPVELKGTIGAPTPKGDGRELIAVNLQTIVDRTEFGVNWNMPLPDGTPALANEVELTAGLFLIREA
jgi:polyisoprenoid-binding protein YceI